MTNREMIKLIRKNGYILVPVLTKTDVIRIRAVKLDLIAELEHQGLDNECPWLVIDEYMGTVTLDVA